MKIFANTYAKNIIGFRELEVVINNKLIDGMRVLYKKAHTIFKTINTDFAYTDPATAKDILAESKFEHIYFKINELYRNVYNIFQIEPYNSETTREFMNILEDTKLLTDIIHTSPPVINNNIHSLLSNRIYIVSNYFKIHSQFSFKSNDIYDAIIETKRLNRIIRNDEKILGVWGGLIVNNLNACRLFAIDEITKE